MTESGECAVNAHMPTAPRKLNSAASALREGAEEVSQSDPAGDRERKSGLKAQWLVVYGASLIAVGNLIAVVVGAAALGTAVNVILVCSFVVSAILIAIGLAMFLAGLAGVIKHR